MSNERNLVECKVGYTQQFANDKVYSFEADRFGRFVAEISDERARAVFLTNSAVYRSVPDEPEGHKEKPAPRPAPSQAERQKQSQQGKPAAPTAPELAPYKVFTATTSYDAASGAFLGSFEDGDNKVEFSAAKAEELEPAFRATVDAYLEQLDDDADDAGEGADDDDVTDTGGDDGSSDGDADGADQGSTDGDQNGEDAAPAGDAAYTAESLDKMTKPQIIALADEHDIVVNQRDTKAKIIGQFLAGL